MGGIGGTLRSRWGPLPVWTWAAIFIIVLSVYLIHRRNTQAQAAAANQQGIDTASSSNLGTVPISNLTTQAQPMPIQMGDTFVDTSGAVPSSSTTNTPTSTVVSQPAPATLGVTANNTPSDSLSGTGPTNTQPAAP